MGNQVIACTLSQGIEGVLSYWRKKCLLVKEEASPHVLHVQRQSESH